MSGKLTGARDVGRESEAIVEVNSAPNMELSTLEGSELSLSPLLCDSQEESLLRDMHFQSTLQVSKNINSFYNCMQCLFQLDETCYNYLIQ